MKLLPPEAVAQLESGRPIISGALRLVVDPEDEDKIYRFWSGYGTLELDGENFKGIGARALIAPVSSRAGGAADGVTITLSQLDPDVAASVELEQYHQKPVTLWRCVFAPDGHTKVGEMVMMRGRLDVVPQREKVGGEAALDFQIEGPRRDMNRSGARMTSDADQRVLGGPTDGSLKHVSTAPRKMLNWGARPAVAGGALGGGDNRAGERDILRALGILPI